MKAIADTVPEALRQGLHGWAVTDCTVTLTHSQYAPRQSHSHQGFSKAMSSIGSDFRLLTPLVLIDAAPPGRHRRVRAHLTLRAGDPRRRRCR